MNVFLGIIGGLGLFLYGMKLMGDGLQKVAGDKMRNILETLTRNKIIGMLVGIVFTGVIQSSSAATVLVVSFVDAGLMNLSQATGVILGANIGTTVTGQLLSFNMAGIAPVFIMIGVIMIMFMKQPFIKRLGEVILGFGVLFFGMNYMSTALEAVKHSKFVMDTMGSLTNPFLAFLVGLVVTAVLQSSSAAVGILIVLSKQGMIGLPICFFVILGCNIGACVSAGLASLNGKKNAKRAALIHLLFNVIGSLVFFVVLLFTSDLVFQGIHMLSSSAGDAAVRAGRDVANTHTIFKVVQVLLMLPFTNYLVKLTYLLAPGDDAAAGERTLQFIGEHSVYSPTAAVPQAILEIERMGNLAFQNLDVAFEELVTRKSDKLEDVYEREKTIDFMNTEIVDYLLKVNQLSLPMSDRLVIGALFHVVSDIERIGDHAENVADFTKIMLENNLSFSKPAINEIVEMYRLDAKLLKLSLEMFTTRDDRHLEEIMDLENQIDELERELQNKHVKRLTNGICEAHAGTIFSDLCSNLERVGDHATNIAYSVLESDPEPEKQLDFQP